MNNDEESTSFDTASSTSSILNTDNESPAESDAPAEPRRRRPIVDSSALLQLSPPDSDDDDDDDHDEKAASSYSSYSSSSDSSAAPAPQREPAGFAHNEAMVKLTAALESAVLQAHWGTSRTLRKLSFAGWRGLTTLTALAALIVAAVLRASRTGDDAWPELLLMCLAALVEAVLAWRRRRRQRLFVCERAARHVAALRRGGKQHTAFLSGSATPRTPSLVLVSCKRGGTWAALPVQLLVDGDAVALEANERAPAACHAFGPLVCRLKAGEPSPLVSRAFFIVDETPAARQLGATVDAVNARRPSRVALAWRTLAWRVFSLGGVLAALALVAGVVRCVASGHCDAPTIGELIFSRPAAVWIAAIGFGNQLLQLIVYAAVNAQMVTLFDVLERNALDKAIERVNSLAKGHADSIPTDGDAGGGGASGGASGEATSKRSDADASSSSDSADKMLDAGAMATNTSAAAAAAAENGADDASGTDDGANGGDAAYEHAELLAVKHTLLPLRDVWRNFVVVATSRHEFIGPYDAASFTLGSASALLVIDKAGVMADPVARPVRVLLPQYVRRRKTTSDVAAAAASPDAAAAAAVDRIADFGIALTLHRPSTTARHSQFEHSDLVKHLAALKPIGLNVLLERPCRLPPHVLHRLPPRHLQSSLHVHDQCLCALGREIGFTDAAMAPFAPLRVVYANFATGHHHHHHHHHHATNMQSSATEQVPAAAAAPNVPPQELHERYHYRLLSLPGEFGRSPPALHALVVQQAPSGALQLLSRGNAVSVIDHCSHRFDGSAVRLLTLPERRALLSADAAWRRQGKGSLAFAYKPVPHAFYALLQSDAPAPALSDDGAPSDGAPSATTMATLVGGQVFIGMVSVSLVPRLSPTFVQALRSGGVRFKYMSPDSTRTTVAFAGKLGLETEWSFVISLKESSDGEVRMLGESKDDVAAAGGGGGAGDDDDFAARFASQVDQLNVKPPSGVTEVRQYIEQTQDDMPLRVSVHTNCTKKAITDMIRLMQDQGEIVCVMGASVNAASSEPYRVADVAFSVPPQRPECLDDWSAPPTWLARERRHELQHGHPLSIVALLASLPCALVGHTTATDHDVLLALHLHARATMQAAHRVSVFYTFATGTVVSLLGVGQLLSWMAPLDVWHVFAVAFGATLPLSVGQLLHGADSSLARRLPGKYAIPKEQAGKLTSAILIIVLPTLVQLLFVFVAALYSLFRDAERDAWGGAAEAGDRWLGVQSVANTTRIVAPLDDQLAAQLALARNVTWLALVCDLLVAALLVNSAGRRRFAPPSPLWVPLAVGVLLPPVLVVALDGSAPQIEWYVWFVLLVWPTLVLFPLALLSRRSYWYWYEKYQAYLEMEFNTVLPAWSPVVQNKEQADQVAKYGGHRQVKKGDDRDDW